MTDVENENDDNNLQVRREALEVYKNYRSCVEHEDRLTTDRLNRTLLVHGFLIASYVLMLQARVSAIASCLGRVGGCSRDYLAAAPIALARIQILTDLVLVVVALIGIVTTMAAARGVSNSKEAIYALKNDWDRYLGQLPLSSGLALPSLIHQGTGRSSTSLLIKGLTILWIAMLSISLSFPFVLSEAFHSVFATG